MRKSFTLILIGTTAIVSVIALVRYIKMDSFSFAWILNFLLMFFVSLFTNVWKSPFSSSYYDKKGWERNGKLYEHLGINFFKKVLVWIGWEKLIRKSHSIDKSKKALENLYYQTKKSELDHLIILIIVMGFNIYVAFTLGASKSVWLLLLNVIFHLYPIFLQRYNRPRITKAISFQMVLDSRKSLSSVKQSITA